MSPIELTPDETAEVLGDAHFGYLAIASVALIFFAQFVRWWLA